MMHLGSTTYIYVALSFPGAFFIWIKGGFKISFLKLIDPRNSTARLYRINIAFWVIIILFFFIRNNYLID